MLIFFAFDNLYRTLCLKRDRCSNCCLRGRCLGHQCAHGHPRLFEQVFMAVFPAPLVRPNVLPKKDIARALASRSHIALMLESMMYEHVRER